MNTYKIEITKIDEEHYIADCREIFNCYIQGKSLSEIFLNIQSYADKYSKQI